ncbi:MAG: hypothetical protein QOI41_1157 [Myxococcales bacterium]|nr:hypothetical protein [Myxococcales bacterium]
MKLAAALVVGMTLLLGATSAEAALTSSEKGQIRDFVASAHAENAVRVRSLVARTDLTVDESIAALSEAVTPVPFTDQRAIFLRELTFGVSSASSRPLLAQAVTHAMLARADAVFQKYVGGLDHEPRAIGELVAIYAFLDGTIANAGRPTLAAHDASAGISAAAYELCSKELRDHVDHNARWLKGDGAVAESLGRVRAQAQAALLDMLPDGLTRRVDASDRLGLKGARRQMLTDWGVLLQDAGKLDDAKAAKVREALVRLPGARVDLELLYAGEDRGPLRTRGLVAFAGGTPAEANPFGDELTPTTVDTALSTIVQDLAVLAAKRALDNRGELRLQAERDAAAAHSEPAKMLGRPRAPSVDHVVGSAAHLLVTDAPRALDLAFVRVLGGHPESAALLSDAVGALAAFAVAPANGAPEPRPGGLSLELGKGGGATTMSAIRLAPNGAGVGFTLDGHTWAIDRPGPAFVVTAVTRDGQPLSLAHLATARTPLRDASTWSEGGWSFTKLRGTPRAGIAPSSEKGGAPTVKMVGSGPKGYDAIVTSSPGEDFVLEGDLTVRDAPGGVTFRAASGRDAVRGALLIVTPGGRAALVTSDDQGNESLLAAPIEPAPSMPVHVKITVKGTKVEAVVGQATLSGTLPASLAKGDIGLVAKRGSSVDFAGFSLKKK